MQTASEMVSDGIKAILPPDVMSYQIAFLQIAGNVVKGSSGRETVTEYSGEKQQLLMFEIALETIRSMSAGDPYSRVANNRHHLVSDTKTFLKDTICHMKWDEALRLKGKFPEDTPAALFCGFFDNYIKKASLYKGSKFFDVFIAYKELYEFLKKGNKVKFNRTLIIEDFDDMEPIFLEITGMLEKSGVKVVKTSSNTRSAEHGKFFYNFMTPIDEAEVIGFKIKEMLATGVSAHDISVVYYNSDVFEILQLVFDRFGIAYYTLEPLKESPVYEAFRSAADAAYSDFNADTIVELLSCESSAFRTSGFTASMVVNALSDMGYRVQKEPVVSVLKALNDTAAKREIFVHEKAGDFDREFMDTIRADILALTKLASFIDNAASMNLISVFLESVASPDKKNAPVYSRLASSITSMDKTLAPYRMRGTAGSDFKFMLEALFEVLGSGEYVEFIDPVKEKQLFETDVKEDDNTGSFISMLPAMLADNTGASRIFACGMDASMDKPGTISYPAALALELSLPLQHSLKEKKLRKFARLALNAAELHASYAYLDFGAKVLGVSNAARVLPGMRDVVTIKNADNSLIRSYDIINKGTFAPDDSYRYKYDPARTEKFNAKKTAGMPRIMDLFAKTSGKPAVRVIQLADFVTCPRRLIHLLIANNAGLEDGDMSLRMSGKKGDFWHRVFELAAREQNLFNSPKRSDIEKAMLAAVDMVLAEKKFDPEAMQEKSAEEFLADVRFAKIPVFAINESARKKRLPGLRTEMPETKLAYDAGAFLLEGTMDRLDTAGDTAVLWDYKTGANKDKTAFSFLSGKTKFKQKNFAGDNRRFDSNNGRDAVQTAVYTYMLSKTNIQALEPYRDLQKAAGIIYIDGDDNLDDIELIKQQWPETKLHVEKTLDIFTEFIQKPANILELPGVNDTMLMKEKTACNYCVFTKNCRMLLMKGGE
jgi:hypothetical protein